MSDLLPADEYPFEHEQVVSAGFDTPTKVAYSHSETVQSTVGLTNSNYIHEVRERLQYTCPNCQEPTVEPRQTETRDTIPSHVSCSSCDWQGTKGDMERLQLSSFIPMLSQEEVYSLWNSVGSVANVIESGSGKLSNVTANFELSETELRETVIGNTPEALHPSPPPLTERFTVDEDSVQRAMDILRDKTPYDDGRLRQLVKLSHASRNTRPSHEQLIKAQDGIGLIDGALQQKPITSSDEEDISKGYEKIEDAVREFVEENAFSSVQESIIAVKAGFEPYLHRRLRSDVIAAAVDCNEGYVAEFELVAVEPFPVVLKKDYVASRETQPLTERLREKVLQRDEECSRCGATEQLDVHHIIPVAQGGGTHLENLATLCRDCHKSAHGGSFGPTVVYDEFSSWTSRHDG